MEQSRLRELENQCIQDCSPPCTSLCPVHVDIRQMTLSIGAGDFAGGLKIFRKAVPFPEIVARTCDQPCQVKCNREMLGGIICVADLERACVEFSTELPSKIILLPKKKARVAVVGGGLSGLTAAFELARKGYQVELFEQQERLGGRLWEVPETQLPRDILERETDLVEQVGVKIHLAEKVTVSHEILSEVEAVYFGLGDPDSALAFFAPELFQVNPDTFQTSQSKIFAGGSLLHPYSSILSISDGRRAAISIDRFLQKVSLTAARVNEGAYQTNLYTNLAGLPSLEMVAPGHSSSYTKEQAQAEAKRCLQCECMECVKVCEYLKHYGGYPKKYVREIYNNLSMLVRARTSNNFINSCALCGLCGEVCPNDLNMGQVNRETREKMVETTRMPASAHDFALRDMAFSNGEKFALARNAPGSKNIALPCSYVFFPGCQLSGSSPEYVEKAYGFLRSTFQDDVGLMLRCCGAPADWAGRKDLFAASQVEFLADYKKLGKPKVILACSSCYQVFQRYFPEVEILSFWQVYDQYGPQEFPGRAFSAPLTIHDPCSTRYESGIQDAVRNILRKIGCEVQELALSREKTECCSYGGLMWLANKPVAEKAVQRRINESSLDYVTYCAMCRDFFARRGKRTYHLLDFVFGAAEKDLALAPAVGFSERHENRARLKEKLLKEFWSELMPEQSAFESIRLILPEPVQKMVEERLILVEDMQKVVEAAERTGKRMFNSSTGHYLAYFKPHSVTYWVEYIPQDDGSFLVYKAYSHRMEIGFGAAK